MPDINIREENKVETLSSRYPRLGPATRFLWLILVDGPITDTSVKSCVRNADSPRVSVIFALAIEGRFMERPVTGPCRNE